MDQSRLRRAIDDAIQVVGGVYLPCLSVECVYMCISVVLLLLVVKGQ